MVAESAEVRLVRDGFPTGLINLGFENLFGLNAEHVRTAARTCGILHDLGKLQMRWQQWASAWQLSRDSSYKPAAALAHTDFDADNPQDRKRQQSLIRRPPHATASGYYACSILEQALNGIPVESIAYVASACTAAIIAHHGAFLPNAIGIDLGILELSKGWEQIVSECLGFMPDPEVVEDLTREKDREGYMGAVLQTTMSRDTLQRWWPLVSYLMRTLRLSDQRATSEWACSE
jgi:CRISPR-associated endonuclease/helicase Cas3